jgi:hypothetical protein
MITKHRRSGKSTIFNDIGLMYELGNINKFNNGIK